MSHDSGQKFIGRNRAPRVQIEYDVELYGASRQVELPFVVGVMADLSGRPAQPLPPIEQRKALEIDIDNFDERMRALRPRVALSVPNTLGGEGQLAVQMEFQSLDDFSPGAIARHVEPLRRLLAARTHLADLLTYMDGKAQAEELLGRALKDPALLRALGRPQPPALPAE